MIIAKMAVFLRLELQLGELRLLLFESGHSSWLALSKLDDQIESLRGKSERLEDSLR